MKNFNDFYEGMRVRLTTIEGEVVEGIIGDIIDVDDNPEELPEESIILDGIKEYGGYPQEFSASFVSYMEVLDK